jgi:hypothetical protein
MPGYSKNKLAAPASKAELGIAANDVLLALH